MRIYWTNVEFKFKENHPDSDKYKGGEVFAFVKSKDTQSALERFKKELNNLHYEPFDFEFIKPYDLTIEWEEKSETERYRKLNKITTDSDDVIFDDFYVYEQID